jgi:hypothetical protein
MSKCQLTDYGFNWGPLNIERACSDDKKGWVLLLVKTEKYQSGIEVYVTKTGKVRVFGSGKEWKP